MPPFVHIYHPHITFTNSEIRCIFHTWTWIYGVCANTLIYTYVHLFPLIQYTIFATCKYSLILTWYPLSNICIFSTFCIWSCSCGDMYTQYTLKTPKLHQITPNHSISTYSAHTHGVYGTYNHRWRQISHISWHIPRATHVTLSAHTWRTPLIRYTLCLQP